MLRKFLLPLIIISFLLAYLTTSYIDQAKNQAVGEQEAYADEYILACEEQGWRDCYGRELSELTSSHGIEYAVAVLDIIQSKDERVLDCHIPAHYISSAALEKDPSNWEELIRKTDLTRCSYGFIHGTLEGLARYDDSFKLTVENIPEICHKIQDIKGSPGVDQACAHVVGHVLASETCPPTVEEAIRHATITCNQLPYLLQRECNGGAFMESFTRDNMVFCGTSKIPWNEETIAHQEDICFSYSGMSAVGCWQEISHMYIAFYGENPQAIFELCDKAPEKDARDACFLHATATFGQSTQADSAYFASICEPVEEDEIINERCIRTVVGSLMGASTGYLPQAKRFCESQGDKKSLCYSSLSNALGQRINQSQKASLCNQLPEEFRSQCLN